jgi:hypothetical protein
MANGCPDQWKIGVFLLAHCHGFAGSVGGPASHGCVRLSTGNAKTLFRLVEQQRGLEGFKYDTRIIVR